MQQHAFTADARVLSREVRVETCTLAVEQKRIFECFLREDAFSQARQEDEIEGQSCYFRNRRHEHSSVSALRGFGAKKHETDRKSFSNFIQRHRTNRRHRPKLSQYRLDHFRLPKGR